MTAFLVESCKALHPEPAERVVEVLELIMAELRNTTSEHSPARPGADTRFVPAHIAPLVNALWSTSLTISLSVAFIGLLVKQWLGEYTAGLMNVSRSRVSKKHAHARQHRHDALRKWRVQMIIAALPVLLQIALFFFLVGLTQLFMAFNRDVGIVTLSFLMVLAVFSSVTTLLPTLVKDCSYRSPQALVPYVFKQLGYSIYCGILSIMAPKRRATVRFEEIKYSLSADISTASSADSATIQKRQSLRGQSQSQKVCLSTWLKEGGGKRIHWNWKDREEAELLACQSGYEAGMLDELDRVKMDVEILRKLVQPCLRTLSLRDALACVRSILTRRADAVVDCLPSWAHGELDPETLDVLVDLLLDVLQREDMVAPSKTAAAADSPRSPSPQTYEGERLQLLEMLKRLVMAGNHFALSGCNHDRLFKVLMTYRRLPEISAAETETPAGGSRQLIYIMLSALGSEIPASAVIPQGALTRIGWMKR